MRLTIWRLALIVTSVALFAICGVASARLFLRAEPPPPMAGPGTDFYPPVDSPPEFNDPPVFRGPSAEAYRDRAERIEEFFTEAHWSADDGLPEVTYYMMSGMSVGEAEREVRGLMTDACTGCTDARLTPEEIEQMKAGYSKAVVSAKSAKLTMEMQTRMVLGQTYDVTVAVQGVNAEGLAPSVDRLADSLSAPTALSTMVDAGDQVRVELIGSDFEIVEQKGGWQAAVDSAASIWSWSVTPRTSGSKEILVALETRFDMKQTEMVTPLESYSKVIDVEVSPLQWVAAAGTWGMSNLAAFAFGICTLISGAVGVTQIQTFLAERKERAAKSTTTSTTTGTPKSTVRKPRSRAKPKAP